MKRQAILTFDLEFWHNSQFLKKYLAEDKNTQDDCIIESVEPILNLLNRCQQKATFFVLGQAAEKYPEIIKEIHQSGCEIASHGYSHKTLNQIQPKEFEEEITKTNRIIETITNRKPIGFRAPAFSLNNKTKWAVKILEKHNFEYDSSVSPLSIYKIPPSIIKEIPSSLGGVYFRMLPLKIYLSLIKNFAKTNPPILYFHPYELFDFAPKINSAPWLKRKIKYWGTKNAWEKFGKLTEKFDFFSIKQYLEQNKL